MEKIMYLVRPNADDIDTFRNHAIQELAPKLEAIDNVRRLRMSFADADVARAEKLKMESVPPLPQAMIAVWVNTANEHAPIATAIDKLCSHVEAYLVCESEVMQPPATIGGRTEGTMQLCTLGQLGSISREEFLTIWRESHSQVARDTQSTFGYRQNLVVRKLNEAAKEHTAIVEEHFPEVAMDSPHAFYDAVGDDEKLQKNLTAMIESCARFIDNDSINVVHMSEYTVSD